MFNHSILGSFSDEKGMQILSSLNSPGNAIELVDSTKKVNNYQTTGHKKITLPWKNKVEVKHTMHSAKKCRITSDQKENEQPEEQVAKLEEVNEESKGEECLLTDSKLTVEHVAELRQTSKWVREGEKGLSRIRCL